MIRLPRRRSRAPARRRPPIRVESIRDPDTGETLGWLVMCSQCGGYAIPPTGEWERAIAVALQHCAVAAETAAARWRWR